MPRSYPDWSNVRREVTYILREDLSELAARLGSINIFDRDGVILPTKIVIRHVEVAFPPGPCALVHISIWRFEHQLYPTNPDDDFCWEDHTIAFNDEFELDDWPYTLTIRGWSEAEDYEHTITVRIELGEKVYTLADLLAQRTPVSVLEE